MKKYLSLACLVTLLSSTEDDDKVLDNSLNGEWTLTNVICFCGFPNPTDFHLTALNFQTSENTVVVNNSGNSVYFMESGTYSFSVSGNSITFDDGNSYKYEVKGNTLILSYIDVPEIADDEITYFLER